VKTYRFAILACSAAKLDRPAPARELYTGALFKLSLQYAELVADRILILSALHGVLEADTVVEPYDVSLPTEKHRRTVWGSNASNQLREKLGKTATYAGAQEHGGEVLCLAPQSYVEALGFIYGPSWWIRPLKGLGIGSQRKALAELITKESARPAPKLAELVLQLDELHAGESDAPFELDGLTWSELVAAARRRVGRALRARRPDVVRVGGRSTQGGRMSD
jgi:hypothetical protein